MLKKNVLVWIVGLLLTTQVYAERVIALNPKESKSLTNHLMWTLNAKCNVKIHKHSNTKIVLKVLENNGIVNGKSLSKGQKTSVNVKNNDNISVTAEPGTTVSIVNLSTQSVQAVCST